MINSQKKIAQCLVYALLFVLLSSCSGVQVSYRFLDDLLRWRLNDYVSIEGPASRELDAALSAFHRWHRSEQLPLYVDFLSDQMRILQGDKINAAQLQQAYNRGMHFWQLSMQQLAPELALTLSRLDEAQLRQLAKNMDQKNAEYEAERINLARTERRQERIQRMRDRLEDWLGSVTDTQAQRIEQWADDLSYETAARLAQRRLLRQRFDGLLSLQKQPQRMQQQLIQLIATPQQQWTPAYRQYSTLNQHTTYQLLIDLHASLTVVQAKTLLNRLDGYRSDFSKLAAMQ